MDELMVFNYETDQIRTLTKDGEPWFVAKDVCEILELGNASQALSRLDEDEKDVISNDTPGGNQLMLIVNEMGLYSLILGSRKPEAKTFKRWITHEVIPSIRKHGGYLTPAKIEEALLDPDVIIRLATDLKNERAHRQALQTKVERDKPKTIFADAVTASSTSILVGDLAKIIKQNGIDIGPHRLFEYLREEGYLIKGGNSKNMPTQRSMEMGLFEVKESAIANPDGSIRVTKTTKVTGKGQVYFVNHFMAKVAI